MVDVVEPISCLDLSNPSIGTLFSAFEESSPSFWRETRSVINCVDKTPTGALNDDPLFNHLSPCR